MNELDDQTTEAIKRRAKHEITADRHQLGIQALGAAFVAASGDLASLIHSWMNFQGFGNPPHLPQELMLIVTELAEACEAHRTGATSDKIPEFTGVEEELADAVIRIFDTAQRHNLRLGQAIIQKMLFNLSRPYKHGKEY